MKKLFHNKQFLIGIAAVLVFPYFASYALTQQLMSLYRAEASAIIRDRNGNEIAIAPNARGEYMRPLDSIPENFKNLLLKKEDRYFFLHPGINPLSIARAILHYPQRRKLEGSSTLTQQLVKSLLSNENSRNIFNKIIESAYAISLELHVSKNDILKMYADTAYFGNGAEGLAEASKTYFAVPPEMLDDAQAKTLTKIISSPARAEAPNNPYPRKNSNMFELDAIAPASGSLTIDSQLTDTVRKIVHTNLSSSSFASVKNGAVVVIYFDRQKDRNELIAIVGSHDPSSAASGNQINMATRPRPIGSTSKPLIYAKAFEKGARPYTQVEDTEYEYDIGTGFAFYPKNYDGKYRGTVTLHEALSNSLNVPAVRVLQYAGLENFYDFLTADLSFKPLAPLDHYALAIALGGLEMDPLTLANYFTIFPNEGILKPLYLSDSQTFSPPMTNPYAERRVVEQAYAQLVTKILSDRETSIDQFGFKSNLNLPATNYALKTGTSYDYHDSWTIGYTPDFLVAVWLGNSDNTPMYRVSGSVGAGKIWHEVMEVMLNSPYNHRADFNFARVKEFTNSGSLEYGLSGDDYQAKRTMLKIKDVILSPHNRDVFAYTAGMAIPLVSLDAVRWYIDKTYLGSGTRRTWQPARPGTYAISAINSEGKKQSLTVFIKSGE